MSALLASVAFLGTEPGKTDEPALGACGIMAVDFTDGWLVELCLRPFWVVALAAMVSGLLAVVFVLGIELLGFCSSEQLEQAFGIPALGSIPELVDSTHSGERLAWA